MIENGSLVNGRPLMPEVTADILRQCAAPGMSVLPSHGGRAGRRRGRLRRRGCIMNGRRFWMVDHPHGTIVDGPGTKVVLPDSESEDTLGESCLSSKGVQDTAAPTLFSIAHFLPGAYANKYTSAKYSLSVRSATEMWLSLKPIALSGMWIGCC